MFPRTRHGPWEGESWCQLISDLVYRTGGRYSEVNPGCLVTEERVAGHQLHPSCGTLGKLLNPFLP